MEYELSDNDILKIASIVQSEQVKKRAEYLKSEESFLLKYPGKYSKHIFKIIELALKNGKMGYTNRPGECFICGNGRHVPLFKSGQRKGEKNYDKEWYDRLIDYKDSFVSIANHTPYGVCFQCHKDGFETELKHVLASGDFKFEWNYILTCPYKKDDIRICFKCGKEMYESEMGKEQTLMGDGSYPATCPHCGAKSLFLGNTHKSTEKFRIIEVKQ